MAQPMSKSEQSFNHSQNRSKNTQQDRSKNAQQEAVALWIYLERRGLEPTIKTVGDILHTLGIGYRNRDLYEWLRPFKIEHKNGFRNKTGTEPEQENEHAGTEPEQNGNSPRARVEVSLVSKPLLPQQVGVVRSDESEANQKPPKQQKLGLDASVKAESVAANKLCKILWNGLESTDNKPRGLTMSGWIARQMRAAREMVRSGVTEADFQKAMDGFRDARGYYPYTLGWLTSFMNRQHDPRPPKPRLEPGEVCFWDDFGDGTGMWQVDRA